MKALVLREDSLKIEEVDGPKRPDGLTGPFVTLDVVCAALNHRDQYIREGLYSRIQLPAILGSDVCGRIAEGEGAGPLVVVDPTFRWGDDEEAQNREMHILGMPTQGGLAEQIIVPLSHIHRAPDHLSPAEAAALPVAGVTAFRALMRQGRCNASDVVLVPGAGGGVATVVIQFALAAGCTVIAMSRHAEKLHRLASYEHLASDRLRTVVMDADRSWVGTVKDYKPTLVVDSVGGPITNDLLDVLQPGGRLIQFGASAGTVPNMNLHRIFWKQITLRGSTMGNEDDFGDMLSFVASHEIRPVVDRILPFTDAAAGFDLLRDAEQCGKIVVQIS
jgi:zinc-binding alcohol dehydrogenase/oxidoreductase